MRNLATARATIRLALFCLLVIASHCQAWAVVDDEEFAPNPDAVQVPGQVIIAESNFDRWVFGNGTAADARNRAIAQATEELERLGQGYALTEPQLAKLALAAQGDVKRVFDQVERTRQKFRAAQNDVNAIMQLRRDEMLPLQRRIAKGLFGPTSLFAKTLRRTLTAEQLAKTRPVEIERSLVKLEESMPLRKDQHTAILKLLLDDANTQQSGKPDVSLLVTRLLALPSNQVKPLLDNRQWKTLQQLAFQFEGRRDLVAEEEFEFEFELEEEEAPRLRNVIEAIGR